MKASNPKLAQRLSKREAAALSWAVAGAVFILMWIGLSIGTSIARADQKVVAAADQSGLAPIQVMVLGTYHFKASTSDLVSAQMIDALAPKRQREIKATVDALAAFEPTIVVTERVTPAPDYHDAKYADFKPEMLMREPNERVQIGYRLANKLGLTHVHGLDEQPSDGEPDYFPFGRIQSHAEKTGQTDQLMALIGSMQSLVAAEKARFADMTIAQSLIETNSSKLSSSSVYYESQALDVGEDQPAAELQGYWFMRNAKIFSKLMDVTKPGDRVLIVFGAGHKHWLDHLVTHTPGYTLVDPVQYLVTAE